MDEFLEKLEHESLREFYFIAISLILAFGVLQTAGTFMNTDRPVVSVVSCSMYPQLHVGDVLMVQGQSFDRINEGDVIVYSVKEVDIEIDDRPYSLSHSGSRSVDTSAGEIQLVNVFRKANGETGEAILSINGQNLRVIEDRVYEVDDKKLEIKDIRGMSIPVVHRVITKKSSYVATKGDNNNAQLEFEKKVEPEQIHGKVLFPIPRVGGLKLLVMDILGYEGERDQPFKIDTYPQCRKKT